MDYVVKKTVNNNSVNLENLDIKHNICGGKVIVERNRGKNQLGNEFSLKCNNCEEHLFIGQDGVDAIYQTIITGKEGKIYIGGEKHFLTISTK